ncbi:MAG: sulfatase [Roseibacillus sp.]|nr:sulfatase [Roseibacillus sp.]
MNPADTYLARTRREFLTTSASGIGGIALGSMLARDGVLGAASAADAHRFTALQPHAEPRAKACIFIFMAGAPSHVDLFDPKPRLNELHGQKPPQSLLKKERFAFIKPDSATLLGSPRKFSPHGECGMEFCDLLPHLGSCADDLLMVRSLHSEEFNHHPGQLLMQCGVSRFGMPTMGSWVNYGLGSPSENLPGYVVLTAGRGSSGGATLWQSGFLPSNYAGVLFRNTGEPVLNLRNPEGLPPHLQRAGLDTLRDLNQHRYQEVHDPEIASRIANYELANRMQSAAPELVDLAGESKKTLAMYGVGRPEPKGKDFRGSLPGLNTYDTFARNCLLARRMVERGVRFINIVHASWDQHSELDKNITYNAHAVDQPIAALIKDLKQRGLLDSTMVVWGAEFGRTPLGENRGGRKHNTGRDHHPSAFTMLLAGGGLKGGMVYGKSDEFGWGIEENPVHVNDLHATMLHQFGLDHLKLTYRFQGRDFRLTDVGGRVIQDWIS